MRNLLFSVMFGILAITLSFVIMINCVPDEPSCRVVLSPAEIAIYKYAQEYEIPSSLLKGIWYAESVRGQQLWSDSSRVVKRQKWVRKVPGYETLKKTYGNQIYWCVGDFQVLFLTSVCYGFKGSPKELGTNVNTNCKYACLILKSFVKSSGGYLRNAIASYNYGSAELDRFGHYINEEYIDRVWKIYTNAGVISE